MTLQLPQSMIAEMIEHAKIDLPNECCGIIAGDELGTAVKLYRTRNAEASPFRYNIDGRDLLRVSSEISDQDWKELVIYHSHVASPAYPSPTDIRLAQWPASDPPKELYPGVYYVLISLQDENAPDVRAFRISDGEVTEEPLQSV